MSQGIKKDEQVSGFVGELMLISREEITNRGIFQKAGISLFITIAGTGLSMLMRFLLARTLETQVFGDFMYVISWVNILATISLLGLDKSSLRFIPSYYALSKLENLNGFFFFSLRRVMIASFLLGIFVIAVTALLGRQMSSELILTFWVASALLPINTLLLLIRNVLLAFKRVVIAQLPWAILRPLFFLLIVGTAAIVNSDLSAMQAMLIYTLMSLGALLLYVYFLRSNTSVSLGSGAANVDERKQWNKSAKQLLGQSALNLVNSQADIVLIGLFLGTASAGIYAVAMTVVLLLDFSLQAVNTVVAPIFSSLYSQNKLDDLQQTVRLTARGVTVYAAIASISIIIGGRGILSLFGTEFTVAYNALVILVIGRLVNSLAGSVGLLMTATGHEPIATRVFGVGAVTSVVLNLIFIPAFGITGAALATTTAIITWNLLMYLNVKRVLGIEPTILSSLRT